MKIIFTLATLFFLTSCVNRFNQPILSVDNRHEVINKVKIFRGGCCQSKSELLTEITDISEIQMAISAMMINEETYAFQKIHKMKEQGLIKTIKVRGNWGMCYTWFVEYWHNENKIMGVGIHNFITPGTEERDDVEIRYATGDNTIRGDDAVRFKNGFIM